MKIITIQVVFGKLLKKYFQANEKLILKLTTLSVQIHFLNIFLQMLIYLEGLKTTIGTWKLPRYYKLRTNEALEFKYVSIIFFKKQ